MVTGCTAHPNPCKKPVSRRQKLKVAPAIVFFVACEFFVRSFSL
jgi:hypothetical protein